LFDVDHAKAKETHAAEEVHAEAREAEGVANEGTRAHDGGVGGLSGADHQMSARVPGQGVVGVKSGGEGAVATLVARLAFTRLAQRWSDV
jgi:hypothetical protein